MINVPETLIEFGYAECGNSKQVVATCPECGEDRRTRKRCADGLCRACSAKHQNRTHRRITVKYAPQIGHAL